MGNKVRLKSSLELLICQDDHRQNLFFKKGKSIPKKQNCSFYLKNPENSELKILWGGKKIFQKNLSCGQKIVLQKFFIKENFIQFSIAVDNKEISQEKCYLHSVSQISPNI